MRTKTTAPVGNQGRRAAHWTTRACPRSRPEWSASSRWLPRRSMGGPPRVSRTSGRFRTTRSPSSTTFGRTLTHLRTPPPRPRRQVQSRLHHGARRACLRRRFRPSARGIPLHACLTAARPGSTTVGADHDAVAGASIGIAAVRTAAFSSPTSPRSLRRQSSSFIGWTRTLGSRSRRTWGSPTSPPPPMPFGGLGGTSQRRRRSHPQSPHQATGGERCAGYAPGSQPGV